jgi:signal transduction histidine kinase
VVSLQAALAAHVLEEHPERAREAMAEIRRISTSALHELRSILDVVRTAEPGALGRASGVAGIAALASVTTKAGVLTRLTVSGRRRLLPSDVDLAAYRIVQESLTNVLRHSGAASASVLIAYEDDRLLMEVDDDGIGAAGPTNLGHGILGMRERASALGGEIEAGPHPQGGYRVRATLPLRGGR